MSWRPGIPLKVEESKWKTSVQPKVKSITIIQKVFPYTPGKTPKRKKEVVTEDVLEALYRVFQVYQKLHLLTQMTYPQQSLIAKINFKAPEKSETVFSLRHIA